MCVMCNVKCACRDADDAEPLQPADRGRDPRSRRDRRDCCQRYSTCTAHYIGAACKCGRKKALSLRLFCFNLAVFSLPVLYLYFCNGQPNGICTTFALVFNVAILPRSLFVCAQYRQGCDPGAAQGCGGAGGEAVREKPPVLPQPAALYRGGRSSGPLRGAVCYMQCCVTICRRLTYHLIGVLL